MTGENYGNILHDNWTDPVSGRTYYRGTELYWTYTGWSLPDGYDKDDYKLYKGMGFCTRAGYTAPLNRVQNVRVWLDVGSSNASYANYFASGVSMVTNNNTYQTIGIKVKLQYNGGSDLFISLKKKSSTAFNPSMDGIVYEIVDANGYAFWTITLGSTGEPKDVNYEQLRVYITPDDYFEYRGLVVNPNDDKVYLHIHRAQTGGIWDGAFFLHEKSTNSNYELNNAYVPIPAVDNGEYKVLNADICSNLNDKPVMSNPYGMVQAFKVDGDGKPLSGVQFGLYSSEANAKAKSSPIAIKTTSGYGIVNFTGLNAGTYYLRELTTKSGYILDDTVYTVTVNLDNTFGVGTQNYGYVFDSEYYRGRYADLNTAYGADKLKLAGHFNNYGINEGRRASANFDPNTYKNTYNNDDGYFDGSSSNANWSNANYYLHYLNYGAAEGRLGRPLSEYNAMTKGVNQNSTPVVVVKVENKKPVDTYLTMTKASANSECTDNNPNYSLSGTTYEVYTSSANAAGQTNSIHTFTMTAAGTTTAWKIPSSYMSKDVNGAIVATDFYIREKTAGKGYDLSNKVYEVTVDKSNTQNNPATLAAMDEPRLDPVQIQIIKTDVDGSSVAEGTGSLEGAEFTIKYYAVDTSVSYSATQLSNRAADAVWTIQTKYNSSSKRYAARLNTNWLIGSNNSDFIAFDNNNEPQLPFGYITIQETKAPKGYSTEGATYVWSNGTSSTSNIIVAKISENKATSLTVGNTAVSGDITVKERPIRGDFALQKVDEDGNPINGVSFSITNNATRESYTITTGADGRYNSSSAGLWFKKKADGTETEKVAGLGALPTGTYTLRELRTAANAGMQLEPPITFTVTEATTYVLKDGGVSSDVITNVKMPTVGTSASVIETSSKVVPLNKDITITDVVSYSGLKVNTDYILVGKLMVVEEDGTYAAYEKNGSDYVVTKTFKTGVAYTKSIYEAKGTVNVDFAVNTSNMDGKKLVVFEKLYLGTAAPANDSSATQYADNPDIFPVSHEDIDSLSQTVNAPNLTTLAANATISGEHIIIPEAGAKVTDTITYKNLIAGTYTVKGRLIDKATGKVVVDEDGKEVTAEKTFTPSSANGTVDVTYTFNASNMAGKTLVCYESVYFNDVLIIEHADINDTAQTVYLPSGRTTVKDNKTNTQMTLAEKTASITDTVHYSNLLTGKTYKVTGTLMDKATGEAVKDSSGKAIINTVEFTPATANGTVEVPFTFDASVLKGKTVVVFEDVYYNNKQVIIHHNINDTEQTIYIPEVTSDIKDSVTADKITLAAKGAKVTDTITYKNLIAGQTYTVTGTLMDKVTGAAAKTSDGKDITVSKELKPTAANGTVDVTFEFDASLFEGKTLVAYQTVTVSGKTVGEEKDINNASQTFRIPNGRTTLLDSKTSDHVTLAEKSATVKDTVTYENLIPGKKYTVTGKLMDKATGAAIKGADGKEISAEKEFTAASANGTVDMTFTFDASVLAGKTIVAFETIKYNGKDVIIHADINDEAQTTYIPGGKTTAKDAKTNDHITLAAKKAEIIDTVTYNNLLVGKTYTVKGVLMDKSTGAALKDSAGKNITSETTFTATVKDGTVNVSFKFDASLLEGKTLVVFEDIYLGNKEVVIHHDINDTDQTIYIPKGRTTALDDKTSDHITLAEKTASITDTITYENLIVGKKYTAKGVLTDKATGKEILDSAGKSITNTVEFTATSANGKVEVPFTFDASVLAGKKIVVFEDMYMNGKEVFVHHDIDDEEQTIWVPDGHTTVIDDKTEDHITFADEEATITDTVYYENLITGKTYNVTGVLMDRETEETVLDADGNEITNTVEFTPEEETGTVDVPFTFDSSLLKGQVIVVFEDVYYNGKTVFSHHDINDTEQTTHVPNGYTIVLDDKTKDHLTFAEEEASITDTIYYQNLIVGKTYTATGVLMDKKTGEAILDADGNEITNTVEFVPEETDGIVEVPFTFDSSVLKGQKIVVFEDVYYNGKQVIIHHEIDDEEQTIWVPDGHTTALDSKTNDHIMLAEEKAKIIDTVTYENLIAGKTYLVTGVLMDKETGKPILNSDGEEITSSVTLTPEEENGTVDVPFTFDASVLAGQTIVVFEDVYYSGKTVFSHHDITDVEQTIHIPEGHTEARDGKTEESIGYAEAEAEIIDTVYFSNLIPGKEYTATGVLMDQETEEPLLDKDGKEVTNSVTFYPQSPDGYINVPFTIDASNLRGKTIVTFEDVYYEGKTVFIHHDITDRKQSVDYPDCGTTATLKNAGKTITAGDMATVVDEVAYKKLIPGDTFIVKGYLMNKATGEKFLVGGKEITAEKGFTAEESDGIVELEFTFSTKDIDKLDLVVFEELYLVKDLDGKHAELLVTDHMDINDKNQTVNIITVPKTGDSSPVLPIAGAGAAAALGIAVIVKKKREEEV